MSQLSDPYISYASPFQSQPPSCITPLSIIGIVLGGTTILFRCFGIAMLLIASLVTHVLIARVQGPVATAIQIVAYVVFTIFAVWLIVVSIASLKHLPWGRAGLVQWAVYYIIADLIEFITSMAVFLPNSRNTMNAAMASMGTRAPMRNMTLFFIVSAAIGMILPLIYPVFVLVFFRRPDVRVFFAAHDKSLSIE